MWDGWERKKEGDDSGDDEPIVGSMLQTIDDRRSLHIEHRRCAERLFSEKEPSGPQKKTRMSATPVRHSQFRLANPERLVAYIAFWTGKRQMDAKRAA
jgi:hypothetical protein